MTNTDPINTTIALMRAIVEHDDNPSVDTMLALDDAILNARETRRTLPADHYLAITLLNTIPAIIDFVENLDDYWD